MNHNIIIISLNWKERTLLSTDQWLSLLKDYGNLLKVTSTFKNKVTQIKKYIYFNDYVTCLVDSSYHSQHVLRVKYYNNNINHILRSWLVHTAHFISITALFLFLFVPLFNGKLWFYRLTFLILFVFQWKNFVKQVTLD